MKAIILALAFVIPNSAIAASMTDTEVRHAIVHESRVRYANICACPYAVRNHAKICNAGSGMARHIDVTPVCHSKDVTEQMMKDWRERNGQ